MMSKLMRRQLTCVAHTLIEQLQCVYCGDARIKPRLSANGQAVNLDHFIPLDIVIKAWPTIIPNFLLPSCLRCNNRLNYQLFLTFVDKFHYIRTELQPEWSLSDNPAYNQLINIEVPDELISMIVPVHQMRDGDEMIELHVAEQQIKAALRPRGQR